MAATAPETSGKQRDFSKTRHFALKEPTWASPNNSQVFLLRKQANYPRFVGGRRPNPLSNNSESLRTILQPDPWSVTQGPTPREKISLAQNGKLFGTCTSFGHSSTLFWPGMLRDPEGEQTDASSWPEEVGGPPPTPRGLTKREVLFEAARTWPGSHVHKGTSDSPIEAAQMTPRCRFGKGAVVPADLPAEEQCLKAQSPRPPECRGKYSG
jgi:hypothetical protein